MWREGLDKQLDLDRNQTDTKTVEQKLGFYMGGQINFFQSGRHHNPFHYKWCCQLDFVKTWGHPYSKIEGKMYIYIREWPNWEGGDDYQ